MAVKRTVVLTATDARQEAFNAYWRDHAGIVRRFPGNLMRVFYDGFSAGYVDRDLGHTEKHIGNPDPIYTEGYHEGWAYRLIEEVVPWQ